MSALDVAAIIRDAKALALTVGREGLGTVHGIDPAAVPVATAVLAMALDAFEAELRTRRAIVTAPALSVLLHDHDEDPGAAPNERPL